MGPRDAGAEGPEADERGDAEEQDPGDREEARPQQRVGAPLRVVAEEGAAAADAGRPRSWPRGEERAQEGERDGGGGVAGGHGRGGWGRGRSGVAWRGGRRSREELELSPGRNRRRRAEERRRDIRLRLLQSSSKKNTLVQISCT